MLSKKEYDEAKKQLETLVKARNRAMLLIDDAQARYVKQKTRARSKKAAMEREAVLNSPRYKDLEIYEKKYDIQTAYGWDCISERERDRLEDLWDEREAIRYNKNDDGFYQDEVTKALLKYRYGDMENDDELRDAIIEEVADVKIMCRQIELIFRIEEEVEKAIEYKVERQKKRLDEFGARTFMDV